MNLSEISTKKLLSDYLESIKDIALCELAIKIGAKEKKDKKIIERIEVNKKIIVITQNELFSRIEINE